MSEELRKVQDALKQLQIAFEQNQTMFYVKKWLNNAQRIIELYFKEQAKLEAETA